jgi:hypothetical protein
MTDGPSNYEFKQQLAALSLIEQVSVWMRLRLFLTVHRRRPAPCGRHLRRRWVFSDLYPVIYVLG